MNNPAEKDMMVLCRALSEILSVVAEQTGSTIDEAYLRSRCPKYADWFIELVRLSTKNSAPFRNSVKEFLRLPKTRRREIAAAVRHDIGYNAFSSGDGFCFETQQLSPEARDLLKRFFLYFYEVVFHHQNAKGACKVVKSGLENEYFNANPAVEYACPICLNSCSNARRETDLEHYFAKSIYPVLAIHPHNLYYSCPVCNSRYKGEKNVLSQPTGDISEVFRPYRDTVREQTDIVVDRIPQEKDRVILCPKDKGQPQVQRKIDNFERVFRVQERWTAELRRYYSELRSRYVGKAYTKEDLRRKLEDYCEEMQNLSDIPQCHIEAIYAKWILDNQFDAFYDSL